MDIERRIEEIRTEAEQDLTSLTHTKEVDDLKVKFLGKKGCLHGLMDALKTCPAESRPKMGQLINTLKEQLSAKLEAAREEIGKRELEKRLGGEKLDVTLPGRRLKVGREHVVLGMLNEAIDILVEMGFSVQYGPDIESDYYNFEALNFPKDHPARDMHDTFYLRPDVLLRTQTSNTQVRVMEKTSPPIRMISPGKCYRNEEVSARSHVLFHQIEGLYIDRSVSFSDLLGTLEEFFCKLLKRKNLKMRFRPSYFPFVEPGVEVDIHCSSCDGAGCSVCKHTGWLEVAGAGMVHPEVLKMGGVDPEEYTGYAWGFGIERLTMLRYGIRNIRLFLEDDMRFLEQF